MVATPAPTPVTTPDVPILATNELLLDQVPPVVASLKVVVAPVHTLSVPVIGLSNGSGLTVAILVVKHPVLKSV